MPVVSINTSRCNGDGICAEVCPRALFVMQNNIAHLTPDADDICIACGHCVAACPKKALSLDGMEPDDCEPIEPAMQLFPEAVEQFLMTRRSCRAFKDSPVEHETLEELLDLTRWAPSAVNRQPVEWIVYRQHQGVAQVVELVVDWARQKAMNMQDDAAKIRMRKIATAWEAGQDPICRKAPCLALAHAPTGGDLMAQDASCAITYLELAAHGYGLGACWAGFVTLAAAEHAPLREHLALPEDRTVYGGLMLGYPKFAFRRIPLRFDASVDWR